MRRFVAVAVMLSAVGIGLSKTSARATGEGPEGVDSALWQVLKLWEARSAGIERLRGQVVRRSYDLKFEVETIGEGTLYFEAPDKGRLDIQPVEITEAMQERRRRLGPSRVKHGADGKPFRLQSSSGERWICDGERLISTNEESRSAEVVSLPEDLRGRSIMNGPLPFLFGLPAEEAIRRFELKLIAAPTRQNPIARIQAFPRRADDQRNWKSGTILLDTRTGLPTHVRLLHPSGNKEEVYSFHDLKVNAASFIPRIFGRNPFRISLRGYSVNIHDPAGEKTAAREQTVPDLIGMFHTDAVELLQQRGLTKKQIGLHRGDPARRPEDVFRVQEQDPPAGAPLKTVDRITLRLWTKAGG